mgnify:CR=1 FL=1
MIEPHAELKGPATQIRSATEPADGVMHEMSVLNEAISILGDCISDMKQRLALVIVPTDSVEPCSEIATDHMCSIEKEVALTRVRIEALLSDVKCATERVRI